MLHFFYELLTTFDLIAKDRSVVLISRLNLSALQKRRILFDFFSFRVRHPLEAVDLGFDAIVVRLNQHLVVGVVVMLVIRSDL